jgi:hypothetical protein
MSSNSSPVITPFAFNGPRERFEPLGKVAKLWEANKQGALYPLRQTPGPPLHQTGHTRPDMVVSQPFTTMDPLNWQQHTPAYSEEPQAVIELLTNIMHSHQSNWDNCHQFMSTLFTSDEHRQVYQTARAWLVTQAPPQTANLE